MPLPWPSSLPPTSLTSTWGSSISLSGLWPQMQIYCSKGCHHHHAAVNALDSADIHCQLEPTGIFRLEDKRSD